jgi:hypothetical protein
MTTIQFTLKPELLGALGNLAREPLSTISPLNYGKGEAATPDQVRELAALGVCDSAGAILPANRAAVSCLARADAFTRIYLSTRTNVMEYIAYFGPDGTITGITNDAGMQIVTCPSQGDAILEGIRQVIGDSVYRSVPFSANLTPQETLVLAALIDLQRKEMLSKAAEGRPAEKIAGTPPAIAAMLARPSGNLQWFSSSFADLFPKKIPDEGEIPALLNTLALKGHVVASGPAYTLPDETVILCRGHLLPTTVLTLTSGHADAGGKVTIAGFSCFISGIHDFLSVDANGERVELETASGAGIFEYLHVFLTDRTVLEKIRPSAQQNGKPAAGPVKRFCSSCGSPIRDGLKFCGNCGAKI